MNSSESSNGTTHDTETQDSDWQTQWLRLLAGPVPTGTFKNVHADFVVHEILGFAPEPIEKGQHHWLHIEKAGVNTAQVAKNIARYLDIPVRNISFSGMKDRFGITRQWFSVELPALAEPDWQECIQTSFADGQVTLLEHVRSHRKLRRGVHKANSFNIVLRDISDMALVEERLALVAKSVANYFGEQRFGIDRQNLPQAIDMFAGKRIKNRDLRGILLSSARSWLFNQYLCARIAQHGAALIPGDVFILTGSHSFFTAEEITPELEQRVAEGDVAVSGPLFGDGEVLATGQSAEFERNVLANWPKLQDGLRKARLQQERRPLFIQPAEFSWQQLDATSLQLAFTLPTGSFATTVLAELGDFNSRERAQFEHKS